MPRSLTRRTFLASAAAAGATFSGGTATARAAANSRSTSATKTTSATASVAWPVWDQRDEQALLDVLNSGEWGRNNGDRVKAFEQEFARKTRARHCIATASGTTALLATFGALDLGPGDEVILPPYTFVATFNAVTAYYALPVFVDTDPATFQIDAKKIPAALTSQTRALLPVHIGGYVADMGAIAALARERKLALVEDACQAWFAEWQGQPVGTAGDAGCFSFQASKNLTSGEGGAVITNNDELATRIYNFHTPTGAKAGQSSGRGANFRLTEFQAALLLAQLTRLDAQFATREANAAHLTAELQKIPGISPARFTTGATRSAYHLYMVRYDPEHFAGLSRARFLQELAKEGLHASSGYSPLNTSTHVQALATNRHYQKIYGKTRMARWLEQNRCPINDRLCEQAFWFQQSKLLGSRSDMDRIVETIASVQKRAGKLAKA